MPPSFGSWSERLADEIVTRGAALDLDGSTVGVELLTSDQGFSQIEVAGACSVLSGVFKHVISEFGCGSVVGLI